MSEEKCPFCTKTIDLQSFTSSKNFYAIYNIAPIIPGHSLVIPERHIESLLELSDDELAEMMQLARKATKILTGAFRCSGFDWSVQDGEAAGQTVAHLHLHIVPRKANDLDEKKSWFGMIAESEKQFLDSASRPKLSPKEIEDITSTLRAYAAEHNL